MSDLGKYFPKPGERELHPLANFSRMYLDSKKAFRAACEFRRKRQGLVFGPAKIYVYFFDAQDRPVEQTHDDWDQDLNTDLLQLHIPAVTLKNESERMGMMMNELFSEVESDFGDGFFNAVLFEKLAEVGLASAGPVSEKLKYIHVYKAHKGGRSYAECASKIDSVIAGCARSLTELLRYEESEAKPVLEDAIAYYLDERFSITDRKRLGLR